MSPKVYLFKLKEVIKKILNFFGLLPVAVKISEFLHFLITTKRLPLTWMDEVVACSKGLLRRGQTCAAHGPCFLGGVQRTAEVSIPDVYYYVFNNARITVNSSSVIINESHAIVERVNGGDQSIFDYSSGHIFRHTKTSARVKKQKSAIRLQNGIALFGNGDGNYYHWLIEILPKTEFVNDLPAQYKDYPLLVSNDVKNIPSFTDTLNIFHQGRDVIYLDRDKFYAVDNLVWITSPSNLPFNLVGNNKFRVEFSVLDKRSLDFVREASLAKALAAVPVKEYPERIMFCRRTERRGYNQEEVASYLLQQGFVKVFMEDLDFDEQVRTAYHAKVIVGPTGAVWTNMIFCRPGTRAICWMAEEIADFSAFSTIACLYDVEMRCLTYKSRVKKSSDIYFTSYVISINEIGEALRDLSCLEKDVKKIMKNQPVVTFLVLSYNQEKFIRESVRGAFSQTYRPMEIVISDDFSTDRTYSIIEEEIAAYTGDHVIRVNRNNENLGLIDHVNKIFQLAKGEIIVASAGDDISFPERTSVIVENYLTFGKPLLIHSKAYEIDLIGRSLRTEAPRKKLRRKLSLSEACIANRIYLGASAVWSKKLYEKYGPITQKESYEDLVFGFRALLDDSILYIDKPLLYYRVGVGISPEYGRSFFISDIVKSRKKIAAVMTSTLLQRKQDLNNSNILDKKNFLNLVESELLTLTNTQALYNKDLNVLKLFFISPCLALKIIANEFIFFLGWYVRRITRSTNNKVSM